MLSIKDSLSSVSVQGAAFSGRSLQRVRVERNNFLRVIFDFHLLIVTPLG